MESFTVTAHAGFDNTAENSLETFPLAEKYADVIEYDLNFKKDGTPVWYHNTPRDDETYVTVEETFALLKNSRLKMNVDVKSTQYLEKVKVLAEKYGVTDKIFFTGVGEDWVEAVKEKCPGIPYYLNVNVSVRKKRKPDYLDCLIDKIKELGAVGINLHKSGFSAEMNERFHKAGLLVSVWTAKTKRDFTRLKNIGPDNVTTRINPGIIKK